MTSQFQLKLVAGTLALGVAMATAGVLAAESKGKNVSPATPAGKADGNTSVSLTHLSAQLAQYGDKNKDPLAMVVAAQLQVQAGAEGKAIEKKEEGKPTGEAKPILDVTAKGLLDRAKQYAGDRKDLIALADDVAKSGARGRVGGSDIYVGTTSVRAYTTDVVPIRFRGGEVAVVGISGDGDTDLDLYIYDENGNQICSARSSGDDEICRWSPRWAGEFRIKVQNHGGVSNRYTLAIN